MNMNLSVEDLKTIRLALSSYPLNRQVNATLEAVDAELAKHNLKAVWKRLPKKPYQRITPGEYVFEQINAQ